MPCVPMTERTCDGKQRIVGWLTFVGKYKPGDPPPSGYADKHEWARIQARAGLKQVRCARCGKFRFPQQLARTERRSFVAYPTKRDAINETNPQTVEEDVPICIECDGGKSTIADVAGGKDK